MCLAKESSVTASYCLLIQSDLPDGALLLEVEEDVTPEPGQSPVQGFPSDTDIQLPVTSASTGSHKTTFLERRKEKGSLCALSAVAAVSLFHQTRNSFVLNFIFLCMYLSSSLTRYSGHLGVNTPKNLIP